MTAMSSDHIISATIPKERLLPGLHGLRGIAALAVVLYHLHCQIGITVPEYASFIYKDFGYGVHLFFVLSAISLMYSTEYTMNRKTWVGEYFVKRFFRIVPLFYLMVLHELMRQMFTSGVIITDTNTIFLNLTFIFSFVPTSGIVWAGWAVGVEMLFYCLLPVFLQFPKSLKFNFIVLIAAIVMSIVARSALHEFYAENMGQSKWDWSYFSFISNFCFFVIGIFAFRLGNRLEKESFLVTTVVPTIAVVGLAVMFFTEFDKPLKNTGRVDLVIFGLLFGLLCLWQRARPVKLIANRVFEFLGERSYSVYLLHPVVLFYMKTELVMLADGLRPAIGDSVYFVCALVVLMVVIPCAELTYRFIEIPGIRFGKKLNTIISKNP